MATSKVPPVMPAEAKRKGGGREKIGSRGVVVAAATAVVVVATTSSAVRVNPLLVVYVSIGGR